MTDGWSAVAMFERDIRMQNGCCGSNILLFNNSLTIGNRHELHFWRAKVYASAINAQPSQ